MSSSFAVPSGTVDLGTPDTDLAAYLFLRALAARPHPHLVNRRLDGSVMASALPERARVLHHVEGDGYSKVVAEVDTTLVLVEAWPRSGELTVSAECAEAARAVADEMRERVRRAPDSRRVDVKFTDANTHPRTLVVDVEPWREVRRLYPGNVQDALDGLMSYRSEPSLGRRLMIWYGEPGTGKTTAVRALLDSWRGWIKPMVVTDPDAFLSDGKYLREVLLDLDEEERWHLVVLEDTEALVQKGSRGATHLSKLLNLADGLLGQGVRCLFLLTTNEPITTLHPALTRPGRCLARIEFGALSADEASAVAGRTIDGPRTLAELMAEETVSADANSPALGQYL
jgi:hypothetical protein